MTLFSKSVLALLGVVTLFTALSCKKESVNYLSLWEDIPADTYYAIDPLQNEAAQLYGKWEFFGSSGGFAGGGYGQDFDYLLVKPNAIFGIVRNDSLLVMGKVELQNDPQNELLVLFLAENTQGDVQQIQLLWDNEKFLHFYSDSLALNSPCCDRFNIHLKRVQ